MAEISKFNSYDIKDKKAIRYYHTVADMKSDATLKEGMYVKTSGYYELHDGGHSEYIIINDSSLISDNGSVIALDNGLFAKLIIYNETVNIKQFGAMEDGLTDDTLSFKNAIKSCKTLILNNKTYLLNTYEVLNNYISASELLDCILVVNKDINIIGNNATITLLAQDVTSYVFSILGGRFNITDVNFISTHDKPDASHLERTDGSVYSNVRAFDFDGAKSMILENINITNLESLAFCNDEVENVSAEKIVINNCIANNIQIFFYCAVTDLVYISNCKITHSNSSRLDHTLYISHDNKELYFSNIMTSGCTGIAFSLSSIETYPKNYNNIFIDNCHVTGERGAIDVRQGNVYVNNSIFKLSSTSTNYNVIQNKSANLYLYNCVIEGRNVLFCTNNLKNPNTYFYDCNINCRSFESFNDVSQDIPGTREISGCYINILSGDNYSGLIKNEVANAIYKIHNNYFRKAASTEMPIVNSTSGDVEVKLFHNSCEGSGLTLFSGRASKVQACLNVVVAKEKGDSTIGGVFKNNTIING